MRYHFKTDNHAFTCIIALVNGFGSGNLTNIITCVALNS